MSALGNLFLELDQRLAAVPGVVEYERMPPGDASAFPALHLFDDGDTPDIAEPGATLIATSVTVQGYCEGDSGAIVHDQALELHANAVFALCGDGGDLNGLVQTIEIAGTRRVEVATLSERRRISWAQDFAITFMTPRGDPRSFA